MSSTLNFACATALAVLSHVSAAAAVPQYQITYDYWQEMISGDITVLPGHSMNDHGAFIGATHDLNSYGRVRPFIFDQTLEYIGPITNHPIYGNVPYYDGVANDLNNQNQVVGHLRYNGIILLSYKYNEDHRANYFGANTTGYVYSDHQYYNLNDVTLGSVGVENKIYITSGLLIANSGRIIAEAREFVPDFRLSGQYENVRTILILDPVSAPVPELAGWKMLMIGVSGFTFLTRRKKK